MNILEIDQVKKTYANGVQALKGVSFNVAKGDFFALLGPNGAGKSTLIGILTSLVIKDAGRIGVNGYDLDKQLMSVKQQIGVVPQEFNFSIFEKVGQIVLNQAGYYGVPRKVAEERAEKYLKMLGLWEKRDQASRSLSGGMKRRLMIARALMHQPEVLILDEPTAGVDIELRRSMWEFMEELNANGTTIILTTHYLEEAEALCKNIAIINHGELIVNTKTKALLAQLKAESFILYPEQKLIDLPQLANIELSWGDDDTIEVTLTEDQLLSDVLQQLNNQGVRIRSMRNKANRLEELFLRLTT